MRSFFPLMINLGFVFLYVDLYQRGKISAFGMVALIVGTFIAVNLLYLYLKKFFVAKNVRELKKISHLQTENPEIYLSKLDEKIQKAKDYELDYLTFHKANTLAKFNRNDEAVEILQNHYPLYLDDANKALYFNNLIGLYLKKKDFVNAKKIFEQNKSLLKSFEINKSFGYSILINEAGLYLHLGDKKLALKYLNMAINIAPEGDRKREIEDFKQKNNL
ncbi:MAG: hypothetical protein MSH08_03035 [Ezakiella sp.]|nr:hypothetical protein [Ezakiella sp.]MDD7472447.1 hypothetical protein [Bacillota bacterium]MDY3923180.1 hypothetical protein [Ezakiella sp.]